MFKRLRAWFFAAKYYGLPEFVVNSAPSAENIRVNMTVAVNAAAIRTEVYNGREHLVLPSYTLPDDVVMNGGLYPHEEIERSYKSLEGTFAPLGHPQVNGVYVPAGTPEAINAHHIGAFNRNVERKGNRIGVEKWLDKEVAANTEGGRRLLKAIEEGKPIHTSTGIFLDREPVTNAKSHRWIARNMIMDHDAILLDEPGAATPEDGVGLLVNARVEEAVPAVNGALSEMSYSNISRLLNEAATQKWGQGGDTFVWVEDFDATTAVVRRKDRSEAVAYTLVGDKVTFAESGKEVEQKTSWIDKNPTINRILQLMGLGVNSDPLNPSKPQGESEMTPEELQKALAANNEALLASVKGMVDPLSAAVSGLQANHKELSDALTANSRAAEATKRKLVAEKLGQAAADLLTGNALDEVHAKFVGAAPLIPGFQGNNDTDGYQATKLPE
jgi:hypothetical protein